MTPFRLGGIDETSEVLPLDRAKRLLNPMHRPANDKVCSPFCKSSAPSIQSASSASLSSSDAAGRSHGATAAVGSSGATAHAAADLRTVTSWRCSTNVGTFCAKAPFLITAAAGLSHVDRSSR